jgi:sigma-E factor negative regulatory protein RseC
MSSEEGTITRVEGEKAWVKVRRSAMCDCCKSRKTCATLTDNMNMESEALNTANAKVGDRVLLKIESIALVKVSFLFYMVPVLALLIGALIGKEIGEKSNTEIYTALFAILASVLAFLIVKLFANRLDKDKKYTPEVIKIISSG